MFKKVPGLKRHTIALFASLVVVACSSTSVLGNETSASVNDRYNVVMITVNGLRYKHLGSSGYSRTTTPAMDELAGESIVFSNTFVQSSYTMPNMMTMFTSLYPVSHGVMDAFKDRLSPRVKTLAEVFRDNGYETAGFWRMGSAHLDSRAGFGRGFDLLGDLNRDFLGKEALLGWLVDKKDSPFFLVVNSRSTHIPYLPLQKYRGTFTSGRRGRIISDENVLEKIIYNKFIRSLSTPGAPLYGTIDGEVRRLNSLLFDGNYLNSKMSQIRSLIPDKYKNLLVRLEIDAAIERIDPSDPENLRYLTSLYDECLLGVDQELVRPILSLLEDLNIHNRTIVILTAEHGVGLGEHGILYAGTRFYEDMVHVPLIIRVPGTTGKRNIGNFAQTVDLMPTILELSGLPVPVQTQGRSLVPLIKGKMRPPLNGYVIGSNRVFAYIRTPEWKLIVFLDELYMPGSEKDELFNLLNDPGEMVNLKDEQWQKYEELRGMVRSHLESMPRFLDGAYSFPEHIDSPTRERIRETGYW